MQFFEITFIFDIFTDPDLENIGAIKCYKKEGFKKIIEQKDKGKVWMLKEQK